MAKSWHCWTSIFWRDRYGTLFNQGQAAACNGNLPSTLSEPSRILEAHRASGSKMGCKTFLTINLFSYEKCGRKANNIVILKPNKPPEDLKSYISITLLTVHKLLEIELLRRPPVLEKGIPLNKQVTGQGVAAETKCFHL